MTRTHEVVKQEYLQNCAELGNIEYQIHTLAEVREKIMNKLHNLNVEVEKLQKNSPQQIAEDANETNQN